LTTRPEIPDEEGGQAIEAGAVSEREPETYPWGERSAMIQDPFGFHNGSIRRTRHEKQDEPRI